MRFAKRAVRGDLHRFKAYAELSEDEPDGWRGTIKDGRGQAVARERGERAQPQRRRPEALQERIEELMIAGER